LFRAEQLFKKWQKKRQKADFFVDFKYTNLLYEGQSVPIKVISG
jgi:hypothetical protein